MRVTIVDNTVSVDGEGYPVDCSTLPADVHAVQWDGVSGEVEYRTLMCDHCGIRSRKANATVYDFAPYQPYVNAWGVARQAAADTKAAEAAALAARLAEVEKEKAAAIANAAGDAERAAVEAAGKAAADVAG